MNIHRKAIRYQDEWQCHCCGKSWEHNSPDVPPCLTKKENNEKRLKKLRTQLSGESNRPVIISDRDRWEK